MVNYSQQKDARIQEYSRANANVNYIRGRTRRKGCRSNNFILLRKRSQQNENIITIYRLRSLAKCGSCGASPSVRLKPTAVRVMANPTASETGRGGGGNQARHGLQNQALTQVLVNFIPGTAKPSHNRGQRKGPENTLFNCSVGL